MIHYFNFKQPKLFIDSIEEANYIVVEQPTHEERLFIQQYFQLSLDESEITTPHLTIPICKQTKNVTTLQLFIPVELRFPNTLSIEHKTSPLFIALRENQVLLMSQKVKSGFQLPILLNSKILPEYDARTLFITIINTVVSQYINHAETLIQQLEKSETILRDSRKNEEFIILSEIEESFLTLKSAIDTNISIIKKTRELLDFSSEQLSEVYNALEKLVYLRNTFENHALICQNLRDSLATFISNDLNFTMRALAVITILIAIPNLFFGFFGMNVFLPLADYRLAFLVIFAFVLFFIWLAIRLLKKRGLY